MKRIILIDDHPLVVLSTSRLLEAHGHEVVGTGDRPEQATDLTRALRPDVCLIDLFYGEDGDSSAALGVIGEIASVTDVVVISGSADQEQRGAALAAGAVAVGCKSQPSHELLALVEGRADEVAEPLRRGTGSGPHGLTKRELEVLMALVEGDCTTRIAERLGMRTATARSHVQSIMLKLGVHTRSAAVARGIHQGLVTMAD